MPTCAFCEATCATDELVRHEHEWGVIVHCPNCSAAMGYYRRRTPKVDHLRER